MKDRHGEDCNWRTMPIDAQAVHKSGGGKAHGRWDVTLHAIYIVTWAYALINLSLTTIVDSLSLMEWSTRRILERLGGRHPGPEAPVVALVGSLSKSLRSWGCVRRTVSAMSSWGLKLSSWGLKVSTMPQSTRSNSRCFK